MVSVMRNLYRKIIFIFIITLLSACSFHVKTPIIADYQKLTQLHPSNCVRDDIEIMIGGPQGKGIHRMNDRTYDLSFTMDLQGFLPLVQHNMIQEQCL